MNKNARHFVVAALCGVFAVLFFCSCGKNKNSKDNFSGMGAYLSEICSPDNSYGVEILTSSKSVSMGGKDFYGSVVLGDDQKQNNYCEISFSLNDKIKNVSFYLGSVHYSKAYVDSYETVYVYADDRLVIKKTIYNHDLPDYFVLPSGNVKRVTFKTKSENIITAIGELTAWYGDAVSNQSVGEDNLLSKLMYHIKPYYIWGTENVDCVYSQNGQTVKLNGKEYTDVLEVYFPEIEKWSNEYNAYFNIEGKYSFLYFKAGVDVSDRGADDVFATLCVYSDEKLLLNENFTTIATKSFCLPIKGGEKLTFVWKSVPSAPASKMVLTSMYVR